jgi:hypothetical protein
MARRSLPSFDLLWLNYPREMEKTGKPIVDMDPCEQGREHQWNQCAIRMSIALIASGFPLTHYTQGPVCRHGRARGAQSLGDYLWRQVGRPRIARSEAAATRLTAGRSGVVVFKDISGFRGGRGDHIDLWRHNTTLSGAYFDRAAEVWFWEAS